MYKYNRRHLSKSPTLHFETSSVQTPVATTPYCSKYLIKQYREYYSCFCPFNLWQQTLRLSGFFSARFTIGGSTHFADLIHTSRSVVENNHLLYVFRHFTYFTYSVFGRDCNWRSPFLEKLT